MSRGVHQEYWLYEIYPIDICKAHESGDAHIHDLGFFGPYCGAGTFASCSRKDSAAWKEGGKQARKASAFVLGQIVNSTFTTQGETAGAQAWSSFDTYCAPFVYYDNMTFEQICQCLQEFVFNTQRADPRRFPVPVFQSDVRHQGAVHAERRAGPDRRKIYGADLRGVSGANGPVQSCVLRRHARRGRQGARF